MRWLGLGAIAPVLALCITACSANPNAGNDGGSHGDGSNTGDGRNTGDTGGGGDAHMGTDSGPPVCVDMDMDGIQDSLEHIVPGTSGTADDDDGDGFSNQIEGVRAYPGFDAMRPPLMCGVPDDCDSDGIFNFLDLDSDNDGLTDAEERAHMTNPCAADTDGDGVDDLTEVAAGSDPTSAGSMPAAGSLYVVLPYHPPGDVGMHVHQQFTFATRIRQADVFFLVDNSGSMSGVISALRTSFSTQIVPGVHAAIPDVRFGAGSFDSMPDGLDGDSGVLGSSCGDYTLWVRQKVTSDITLTQNALNTMNTIDMDCPGHYGGDGPEDSTEAIFEAVQGDGTPGMRATDAAARRSVHNARDVNGNGWVPQWNETMDCNPAPDDPAPFGFACFGSGRVPIIVLASDANWYNGFMTGSPTDAHSATASATAMAMIRHGAYFIGVDDGSGMGGQTWQNSVPLAMMTGTVDGSGMPIVFGPGYSGIMTAATGIVNAITTIAGQSRQDITTRTIPDGMESRLMAPHTTADFIKAVTPDHGIPDAPTGYDHHDATTFYNVAPSTQVVFDVDFYNDFQPGGSSAELFQATIIVIGRAGSEVDSRQVYIIVPAAGSQPPG